MQPMCVFSQDNLEIRPKGLNEAGTSLSGLRSMALCHSMIQVRHGKRVSNERGPLMSQDWDASEGGRR